MLLVSNLRVVGGRGELAGEAMTHFRSNLRDIEFNLFELLNRQELLGSAPHAELDIETARGILDEVNRLASGPLAESFADGDRHPPVFDPATHSVHIPESFARSFRAFMDAEWFRLELPPELGGLAAPRSLCWGAAELVLGANPAIWMYASGSAFARALYELGTEEQKRFAQLAVERRWAPTMALTEADAGSDVGAGRTKAIEQPDGTWHIEGVKRFITSGEHDLAENIFHLVLARPEGAGPGTKGLSMFYVPKFVFNPETLDLQGRNGVFATALEEKMGIKASPTCELTFGATDIPAVGYLVGDVHDGIAQMFKAIQYARMMVGVKSIGTLSTAYLHALDYAQQRVQGPDLTRFTDKTAPRVPILRHPDVRRSLTLQKAYAEGLRALYMYAAAYHDEFGVPLVAGVDADLAARVHDLLLPIVKGVGSEKSYQWINESLQIL